MAQCVWAAPCSCHMLFWTARYRVCVCVCAYRVWYPLPSNVLAVAVLQRGVQRESSARTARVVWVVMVWAEAGVPVWTAALN